MSYPNCSYAKFSTYAKAAAFADSPPPLLAPAALPHDAHDPTADLAAALTHLSLLNHNAPQVALLATPAVTEPEGHVRIQQLDPVPMTGGPVPAVVGYYAREFLMIGGWSLTSMIYVGDLFNMLAAGAEETAADIFVARLVTRGMKRRDARFVYDLIELESSLDLEPVVC